MKAPMPPCTHVKCIIEDKDCTMTNTNRERGELPKDWEQIKSQVSGSMTTAWLNPNNHDRLVESINSLTGYLEERFAQALKDARESERERIVSLLENTYGKVSQPALVIIESLEGSVEQRPALRELYALLSSPVDNQPK